MTEAARERSWDTKGMRALYDSNRVAKEELDRLAGRDPTKPATKLGPVGFGLTPRTGTTTVADLVAATNCERQEAVGVLQKFAEFGCGRFITGRRGQPSRLQWGLSAVDVAKEVTGELPRVSTASASAPNVHLVEQPIFLRPGVQVIVHFPEDMTKEEAEKVAGVVRNLWVSPTAKSS
jgi:hypothetical protein